MSLHPDLAALRARYDELYAAAVAGHITGEDATATLAALAVTDGTGALWQIDTQGTFLRADFTGATATPADPAHYVGPETVVSNPETGAYDIGTHPQPAAFDQPTPGGFGNGGFGDTGGFGQPAPGAGFGGPAGFGQAGSAAEFDPWADQAADPATGDPFAGPPIARPVNEPPARSLADADTHHRKGSPVKLGSVVEFLKANKVLVAIAALTLAFVAYSTLGGSDDATLPEPGTTTLPAPAAPDTDNPAPAEDFTADNPAPAAPGPRTGGTPSAKVVDATTAVYLSGNRDAIVKTLAEPAEPGHVAEAAAFYAGLKKAGLSLRPSELFTTPAGTATGTWGIRDRGGNVIVVPVTWTKDRGTWKLAAVPIPN